LKSQLQDCSIILSPLEEASSPGPSDSFKVKQEMEVEPEPEPKVISTNFCRFSIYLLILFQENFKVNLRKRKMNINYCVTPAKKAALDKKVDK
jgi:hypothetical protein